MDALDSYCDGWDTQDGTDAPTTDTRAALPDTRQLGYNRMPLIMRDSVVPPATGNPTEGRKWIRGFLTEREHRPQRPCRWAGCGSDTVMLE